MIRTIRAAITLTLAIASCFARPAVAAQKAHMDPAAKRVLIAYVGALRDQRYADAFRLLDAHERTYFKTPANFASIFKADDLRIDSFAVVGSRPGGSLGILGIVSEKVHFFDHSHQSPASATVTVPYGLLHAGDGWTVKDPYHPWKAFRTSSEATVNGLHVFARKASFFTGRAELVLTFVNIGPGTVTLLPYGRTVLRGDGTVYHPIATKITALTDKALYLGLRLAAGAQYTGTLNFAVPSTGSLRRLELTLAPVLRDGGDAPFEIALPPIAVPPS
jgi:hypothetical protein